jgi:hypothetical protein
MTAPEGFDPPDPGGPPAGGTDTDRTNLEATAGLTALQPGQRLARGVCRAFARHGWAILTEFTLKGGRRADVVALDGHGGIAIVEIKSSRADFRADAKWQAYLEFCDRFYFAVPPDFPRELLPADCGILIADPYDAQTVQLPAESKLHASRRRAVTLRFAQTASQRLLRTQDPAAFAGDL